MTITTGVSFMGQSEAGIQRLSRMRAQMDELARQVGTQKRYETLTGFGLDTQHILQLYADRDLLRAFSDNIDATLFNMRVLSDSMTKITDGLNKIITLVQSQSTSGQFDAALINSQAQQMLDYVADVANLKLNGRYLFAGTDTQNAPVADKATLRANFQAQVTSWLAGGITTTQLAANTDAFSGTALGFSSTIASAQNVSVRIDNTLEVSYGAIADRSGIQDALRALGFLSEIKQPDPMTDVPTDADLGTTIEHILATLRGAVTTIQGKQGIINGSLDLAKSIQDTHKQDINLLSSQIDTAENIDPAEVIVRIQALQTQLTSSYEVTRILSQLSLANFLS